MMTKYEEAIADFREVVEFLCDNYPSLTNAIEHCNVAIEAIGKQIPIKPVVKENENGFDKSYHCPCCDAWLGTDPDDFCNDWVNACNKCYQVIDWSEEF